MRMIRQFISDQSGATAVEYGLIAILLSILIVAAATGIGEQTVDFLTQVLAGF